MNELVPKLQQTYPDITFIKGEVFHWSPKNKQVTYPTSEAPKDNLSLLHETGHALLKHTSYTSDMQLLKKEVAAWQKAVQLAPEFGVEIDNNYVQDCLDSYREWIHKRSSCPACSHKGIQRDPDTYLCLNCKTTWHVTIERFCRPYRRAE
jgi:hypothetical protein